MITRLLVLSSLPFFAGCSTLAVTAGSAPFSEPAALTVKSPLVKDETAMWAPELWKDPRFKRRFVESYIAETDIEPRVTAIEREDLEQILEYISDEKLDRAHKLIDKNRGPAASAVFDYILGNLRFQEEELAKAAAAYKTAVDKFPKFRRAWRNLGLINVRWNYYDEAAAAYTRVIEQGGGDAVTYGLLGFSYANLENHIAAESAYRMANLLDPLTLDWKMGLARSLFRQERFADAGSLCKAMIGDSPEQAELWMLQANAYLGLGEPMRAAENFEVVDRLGKSTLESLNLLGDIYVNAELYGLAQSAYGRALELDPDPNAARTMRAAKVLAARNAYEQTQGLVEAIEASKADGFEAEPRKDLLKLKARLALASGAGDEEARILEEIVTIDPLDGDALILLAQHASRTEDVEKAIFHYERAASLEDYEAEAKLKHGQLLVNQARYKEALPLLRRSLMLSSREDVQEYLEQVERIAQSR